MTPITREQLIGLYGLLQSAKTTHVAVEHKHTVFKAFMAIKKEIDEFVEYRDEVVRRVTEETKDKDEAKAQSNTIITEYVKETVEIPQLDESVVDDLVASNDWTLGQSATVYASLT